MSAQFDAKKLEQERLEKEQEEAKKLAEESAKKQEIKIISGYIEKKLKSGDLVLEDLEDFLNKNEKKVVEKKFKKLSNLKF